MQVRRSGGGCSSGSSGSAPPGVVFGAKVQDWLGDASRRQAKDPHRAARRCCRSAIASASTRSPAASRSARRHDYRLHGERPRRRAVHAHVRRARARCRRRCSRRDFQCVTGWRVPDVHWTGVQLADLLDRAGVKPEATALRFISFDGAYTESLTLDAGAPRRRDRRVRARGQAALAAITADRSRLYVAPMYGYKSCKWLESHRAHRRTSSPGYWEDDGYDVDGWVGRSNGRDDSADVVMSAAADRRRDLPRFDRVERVVHWCNATLFAHPAVHRRRALRRAALDARRAPRRWCRRFTCTRACCCRSRCCSGSRRRGGAQLRADLGRLNRWTDDDRALVVAPQHRAAGAARQVQSRVRSSTRCSSARAIVVMLMTGSIMRWFEPFPDSWRTGRDVRARLVRRSGSSS